jgi:hypothetical protein
VHAGKEASAALVAGAMHDGYDNPYPSFLTAKSNAYDHERMSDIPNDVTLREVFMNNSSACHYA